MEKRKSLVELKKILEKQLTELNGSIESFEGNENTQVKELYNNCITTKEAYKNVLEYINNGSKYQF